MSTSVLFKSKALSSERDMYLVAAFFGKWLHILLHTKYLITNEIWFET
jgi:hypothetical protein